MDLKLNGKRALVCGSTDGIGKASAILMAERGAAIILMARNQVKLEKVREELSSQNNQHHQSISPHLSNFFRAAGEAFSIAHLKQKIYLINTQTNVSS